MIGAVNAIAAFDAAHEDIGREFEIGEGMGKRQPETRNQTIDADNLIDGRGGVPIDVIVNGGANRIRQVVDADMIQLLPVVPDDLFILLIEQI